MYLNILIDELRLENLFDIIISREDVINLKPASDAYLIALEYLNLNKDMCLVLEDSKRGIDASINVGLPTVQVSNFTSIKYVDERAINCNSANEVLKKILNRVQETKK